MGRKAVSYLFSILAVVLTALLLAAAVICWRSSFISPEQGGFWSFFSLAMPVVLLLNLVAFVWWIAHGRWAVAVMPLAALTLNLGYISAMVQLPDLGGETKTYDMKVATFNVHGFRELGAKRSTVNAIANMLRREGVDVACLQEFVEGNRYPADSIAAAFADFMPYFKVDKGMALLSRYPVVAQQTVRFPNTDNAYMQADLLLGEDTVRIFSVHLQTTGLSALRRRYQKDYGREAPVDTVLGTLEENGKIRARQVRAIREAIERSPFPVILAGDFNDTPSSYTYRMIRGDLTDGFRASGSGYGGTYRGFRGLLRIDYIFYDRSFTGVRYYTLPERISDHKAVVAELRIKR